VAAIQPQARVVEAGVLAIRANPLPTLPRSVLVMSVHAGVVCGVAVIVCRPEWMHS
jgi:hypothetical protein